MYLDLLICVSGCVFYVQAWQRAKQEADTMAARKVVSEGSVADGERDCKPVRIIYASRTHSQLHNVVRELRNSAYRPAMAVLASRDRYCVNPAVQRRPDTGAECKRVLETTGCRPFTRAASLLATLPPVWDVGACALLADSNDARVM